MIDHYGGNDTRVFQEVKKTGEVLGKISELAGTVVKSKAAIVYDWDSNWAMEDSQGPRNNGLHYHEALLKLYHGLRDQGLNVDLIDMEQSLEGYEVLALPMVYMFKAGFPEKVRAFVEKGGTLITTCWSGIADETDLCYLGGTPHGLMDVLGLRSAEIDGLYDWEENSFVPQPENPLGLTGQYSCRYLCDLVKTEGAQTVMTYGSDFYAGYPAVTVHAFGKGSAWYVAADADAEFYHDFLAALLKKAGITGAIKEIPRGLEVTTRESEHATYFIYQNFGTEPAVLPLPEGTYEGMYGQLEEPLEVYGLAVLKQKKY